MERLLLRLIEAITDPRPKMEAHCYWLYWKTPCFKWLQKHHGNCWLSGERSHSYTLWKDWHTLYHTKAYPTLHQLSWHPCKYSVRLGDTICQWDVGVILQTTIDQMTIVYCLSCWNRQLNWVNECNDWAIPMIFLQPQSIKLGPSTANGTTCDM